LGIAIINEKGRRTYALDTTHLPPGSGKWVWIANSELVTFKVTGSDTGGAIALVEIVGLPGAAHHRTSTVGWTRSTV
jgi:hypothetical protein